MRVVHNDDEMRSKVMMNSLRLGLSFAALVTLAAGAIPACAGSISMENRPCPCAAGWTCCEGANLCVADGHSCPSTHAPPNTDASNVAATTMRLASYQSPQCITQDRDHLYWLNEDGRLAGVDKRGGPVVFSTFELPKAVFPYHSRGYYASMEGRDLPMSIGPCTLRVDGNFLYATAYAAGTIARVSISSDGAWVIGAQGSFFPGFVTPSSLVIDDTFIYVSEYDSGLIKKLPKDAADGSTVSIIERGGAKPHSLMADTEFLYWSDEGGYRKLSKKGGTIQTLTTKDDFLLAPIGSVLTEGFVDDAPSAAGREYSSVHVAGGSRVFVWPWDDASECTSYRGIHAFAADARDVFFANTRAIYRVPVPNGDVVDFGAYRETCDGFASLARLMTLDGTHVFWTDFTSVWSRRR